MHGLQRIIFAIKMQIIYYRLYNLPESFHDDAFVAKNMKYDSCGPYKILAGEQISWVHSSHLISKLTCNQYMQALSSFYVYM